MSNASSIFRTLITFSLVVPLAVLLGYQLASVDPAKDLYTWMVVGMVLLLLSFPLLMRWHHPLLLVCWNSAAFIFFLPGQPQFWLLMAFLSFGLSIVQRALSKNMRFVSATSVSLPLIFLAAVVLVTMRVNGDFGMRVLGSQSFGGKRYLMLLGAIGGFFAMIAHRTPPHKAALYTGLFLLGTLADVLSILSLLGTPFDYVLWVLPYDSRFEGADFGGGTMVRSAGLNTACSAAFLFLLARYGIKEELDQRKVGRLALLAGVLLIGSLSGFRSFLMLLALTFAVMYYFQGLLRSKYTVILLVGLTLGGGLLVPLSDKLPVSMQRTLSFLPLKIDPVARYSAKASSEWRVEMWQMVLPEVPKYFWLGKGLGMKGAQLELTSDLVWRGQRSTQEVAMLAGDYHSGPLSILIPFGVWGAIGYLWFTIASLRALYLNYRYGEESLKTLNTFLLAHFIARTCSFVLISGGFYSDLAHFVGLIGLSITLNGGICKAARPQTVTNPTPFRLREPLHEPRALPEPVRSQ